MILTANRIFVNVLAFRNLFRYNKVLHGENYPLVYLPDTPARKMIFANPDLMSFAQWATRVWRAYPQAGLPLPFEPWKNWAVELIRSPYFTDLGVPNPSPYGDWHKWAQDFYRQSLALTAAV